MSSETPHARLGRSESHRERQFGSFEDDLASRSPAFQRAAQRIRRFAQTDETVVFQGESGTGKSRLAVCLHLLSRRAGRPFHVVNMAELDDNLASSELFGHLAGAFTGAERHRKGAFATAHGGTICLDEVGKSTKGNQGKLLRTIEARIVRPVGSDVDVTVDVRIIFAASESLEELVGCGRMLPDFLPRLGLFRIVVPPLRERREDIPALVIRLIACHAPDFGYCPTALPTVTPGVLAALVAYDWPRNVRELDGLIRRLLVDAQGARLLGAELLVDELACYGTPARRRAPFGERLRDIERAIERAGGNKAEAARLLGIARATVHRHLDAARKLRSPGDENEIA